MHVSKTKRLTYRRSLLVKTTISLNNQVSDRAKGLWNSMAKDQRNVQMLQIPSQIFASTWQIYTVKNDCVHV